MITGPTGTGKEMVARSVHEAGTTRKGPFVVLDCGAADPGLISSELFGHEAGAFTGAVGRRAGVFEQAQGGTVFIDEVGELPLELQPKLLRVLEAREVRRLGGTATIPLDVRVLAATNRDMEAMVARGQFREDLYYRLCQVKVAIPPLESRREDVPLIVQNILDGIADRTPVRGVSDEVLSFLTSRSFPGNVRQLRNIIERAAQVARGERIEMANLLLSPEEMKGLGAATAATAPAPPAERDERALIIAVLEQHDHNLARTARALGMALNTLKARMQKHGIARRPGEPGA
jgi:DNA-binding NtrC family response regulator